MNPSPEQNPQSRAALTLAKVRAGIDSGQVPMVSQIVQIIKDISGKADKISVSDLADCISREPATMSRIISIAGALGYNPNGLPVTSLSDAVAVIGFERVRNLAIQILLLDSTQSVRTGKINRDLAALCLTSGLFAAEMCHRGVSVEPDLGSICGALRNYGRMLLATFMPQEYKAVTDRGVFRADDPAFRSVFGLTPMRLGREMLAQLNLPPMILNSLERASNDVLDRVGQDSSAALIAVADMGLNLAESLLAPRLTHRNYEARLQALSEGYPPALHLSKEAAKELVADVAARIVTFGRSNVSLDSAALLRRLDCLAHDRPLPRIGAPRHPGQKETAPGLVPPASPQRPSPAQNLFQANKEKLTRLLDSPKPVPQRVFKLMTQTLVQGMELESCVLFLKDNRTGLFLFAHGNGSVLAAARSQVLDPNQRTIFSVPLKRGEDVLIENPLDPGISPFVPEWLKRPGHSLPFLLLPIQDEQGPFALVCAISASLAAFASVAKVSAELKALRAEVARFGRVLRG